MKQNKTPGASNRELGLDPVVAFSLMGAMAFFVISGAVAYFNLQSLRENNTKVVHSHEVIVALDDLLSRTQDAETGQRGFLLTNNERYLEPYNSALVAIPQKLNEIVELTRDNPAQQRRLGTLQTHVQAKLAELKETIDLRRTQSTEAAVAVVNSDRGKGEMDGIRAQLAAMGKEEADLRAQRLAEMNSA